MSETKVHRKSKETEIDLILGYPGTGISEINTGVGFLDHMLSLFSRHAGIDIKLKATGDLNVDAHHTVEDVGICLGKACAQLFTDLEKRNRFGHAVIPMDEALSEVVIDLSGRPYLYFSAELPHVKLGNFDIELTEEFFKAFTNHFKITLHILLRYGKNTHHCIEAIFKAFAKAFLNAIQENPNYIKYGSSTKGIIDS
ncbi:MAG TPA: imidazoleglycerol-phosphate dehydratase HisB [Candidatus Hydrogenedens sp.]|nr:imidazoleglycerol-phosphate dehydratase HisB [Candidatus Hydrogenedens sp.]HOK08514.1 imidazoleglycerol-phosphate dehydratase HisB [Candidatus Hydrogenedens sp.]HOL19002.1 imidazoleglycerol-phosphate dehydratase HisB [Candidatus Hydrogenedens sp.]HPP57816.1 imidazoleglycerol-phosphate dehydratase HisB [Candidatus Hydrogenedens sp.]